MLKMLAHSFGFSVELEGRDPVAPGLYLAFGKIHWLIDKWLWLDVGRR